MLRVAYVCTPYCMLLRGVEQSLKVVKLLSQQLPKRSATMLDPSVSTDLPTLLGQRTRITRGLQRLMGCNLPMM